jgi:hypothetical protein
MLVLKGRGVAALTSCSGFFFVGRGVPTGADT